MSERAAPRTTEVSVHFPDDYHEMIEHARTLERELADCRTSRDDWHKVADARSAELARLASHAEPEEGPSPESIKEAQDALKDAETQGKSMCNPYRHGPVVLAKEILRLAAMPDAALRNGPSTEGTLDRQPSPAGPDALAEPSFQEWWDSCGYSLEGFKPARAAWNRIAEFYRSRPAQDRDAERYRFLAESPAVMVMHKTMFPDTADEHYAITVGFRSKKKYGTLDAAIDAAMSQQEKRDV